MKTRSGKTIGHGTGSSHPPPDTPIQNKKRQELVQTMLEQRKPVPPKRPYALFCDDISDIAYMKELEDSRYKDSPFYSRLIKSTGLERLAEVQDVDSPFYSSTLAEHIERKKLADCQYEDKLAKSLGLSLLEHRSSRDRRNTFISKWRETVGSDRWGRCQSDTLEHLSNMPLSRKPTRLSVKSIPFPLLPMSTKSLPDMPLIFDSPDIPYLKTVATLPSSCPSPEVPGWISDDNSLYRKFNLDKANIHIRDAGQELPDDIAKLVRELSSGHSSAELFPEDVQRDENLARLEADRADEASVEGYFYDHMSPRPPASSCLRVTERLPMKCKYPGIFPSPTHRLAVPVPDALYGYRLTTAFTPPQVIQLVRMRGKAEANDYRLIYPFCVIEFEGSDGDLWAATNRCAVASAGSLQTLEHLNQRLEEYKASLVDNMVFSVAMSGTEARLYISWGRSETTENRVFEPPMLFAESHYYVQKVRSFAIQERRDYVEFCRYVGNILDWGTATRLDQIRKSLDCLREAESQTVSEADNESGDERINEGQSYTC